MAHSVDYN